MPLDNLGADHIGNVGGGFEIQRSNIGLLYINDLPGNENDVVTLSLASFPLPKANTAIIEVPYLNSVRKFAGKTTYEDLAVVCYDFVDKNTNAVLAGWRALVHNEETGASGLKSTYAKSGRAVLFGPDGQGDREFEIFGAWPSGYDPGEVDMGGDDAIRITITLTIDKMVPKFAYTA